MARNILILGASYGSLLGTKLAMAGHNATLVCRQLTADLINREGTEVRIKLRGEKDHRAVRSTDLPGRITAATPENCDPRDYDLVVLAMQEPQYSHPTLRALLNILHVGLPTNFKAAAFENPSHTKILLELERDIDDVRLDGHQVPVKLRVFDSSSRLTASPELLVRVKKTSFHLKNTRVLRKIF